MGKHQLADQRLLRVDGALGGFGDPLTERGQRRKMHAGLHAEAALQAQRDVADRLKRGLSQMKDKLAELKTRRDQLIAREKTAKAQAQVTDALSSINILDPTSELGRFEDRVRRQEALAQGKIELAASSLDAQFAELETDSSQIEIEARLAALKGNNNQA